MIKKTFNAVGRGLSRLVDLLFKLTLAIILDVAIFLYAMALYNNFHQSETQRLTQMYYDLSAKTGQTHDIPRFIIENDSAINAYTDGERVVLFQGMIDYAQNDHEIALIIGHELAHHTLKHTSYPQFRNSKETVVEAEANADKLGAYYMMAAGYDICEGRKIWKRMEQERGNYLAQSHPNYAYRFNELNVGCE